MSTLIERLKNPEDHYEFSDPKKANAVLMSLCQEAADALADIKQDLTTVQDLPFGVGGGLVAIKTLLSRDPCAHANTAIAMIDVILNTPPAQPASASWMEMVVANLVREGVNKHKARELAEHFYGLAQRQWVGLDNSERLSIWEKAMFEDNGKNASLQNQPFVHYAQAIEAKLKEKNG